MRKLCLFVVVVVVVLGGGGGVWLTLMVFSSLVAEYESLCVVRQNSSCQFHRGAECHIHTHQPLHCTGLQIIQHPKLAKGEAIDVLLTPPLILCEITQTMLGRPSQPVIQHRK